MSRRYITTASIGDSHDAAATCARTPRDSARVIPTTIEEGEAAGTAVAPAARHHVGFDRISADPSAVAALRATLARSGVILAPANVARVQTARVG